MNNDMVQLVDNANHLMTVYVCIFKQLNCTIKRPLNIACLSVGERWTVIREFSFIQDISIIKGDTVLLNAEIIKEC